MITYIALPECVLHSMTARAIKKQKQNANNDKPETRKNVGGGGGEGFREIT